MSVADARVTTALYQTAARSWLTVAAISFLLPVGCRLGLWLPLHFTLAGDLHGEISGATQNFMLALTASPFHLIASCASSSNS